MSHSMARERDEFMGEFMFGRVWQVVLTYARQWTFRVQAVAIVAMIVAVYEFAPGWKLMQTLLGETLVIQLGVFSMSISAQLKEQMDDWRSHLTPGFGLPHLGVAGVILGTATVGIPLLLYGPLGMQAAVLLAACLAISALLASISYEPLIIVIIAGLSMIWAIFGGGNYALEFVAGQHIAAAWGVATVSAGMLMALWLGMSKLSGQGMAIDRRIDIHFRRPTMSGSAMRTSGPLSIWLASLPTWQRKEIAKPTRMGDGPVAVLKTSRQRIVQRGLIIAGGVNYWVAGTMGMLVFLGVALVAGFFSRGAAYSIPLKPAMPMVAFGPIYLAIIFCGLTWPQRWLNLSMESLFPASRQEFVRETGAAMGLCILKLWLSSAAVALIGMGIISPHEFQKYAMNLAAIVMVSAAGQFYIFGMIVWGLRLRNGICSVIALGMGLAGSMPALAMQMPDKTPLNLAHAGLWIAALLGVGGLVTLDAYRRWVRTEMD
jgi:hypothetical protein